MIMKTISDFFNHQFISQHKKLKYRFFKEG